MARRRPKKLDQLLGSQRLQQFADYSEHYTQWQQLLRDCFSQLGLDELAPHCEVIQLNAPSLTLKVSSAAVGQRIKTEQGRIITYFQTHATPAADRIEIRIRPNRSQLSQAPQKAPAKQAPTESDTVKKLREQAALCEEPLRSQLLALADKYSADETN